jgi:hypothetical protein
VGAPVVLLALSCEDGKGCVLVDPELSSIVQAEDREYIQSLLEDFPQRAKRNPHALFTQLSSLAVGPLVTQIVGSDLKDYPELQKLSSTFVRL